jgi:glycerol uptake facilitator-like aquaporin
MGLEYKKMFSRQTMFGELTSPIFWKDVVMEGVACVVLMISVVLILITLNPAAYKPNVLHFGLFASFFVYLLIEGYGPINGAHLNSAASFAMCVAGHITPLRAAAYICAQLVGIAIGAEIGFALHPPANRSPFPVLKPSADLSDVQCVFIEACLTFNLLFVALCVNDGKNHAKSSLPALPTAMCIGMGILAAGTHTGGLQNPLVPFGPAILSGDWERHWIYWVGEFLGGATGALTYEFTQWFQLRFTPRPVVTSDHRESLMGHEPERHNSHRLEQSTITWHTDNEAHSVSGDTNSTRLTFNTTS